MDIDSLLKVFPLHGHGQSFDISDHPSSCPDMVIKSLLKIQKVPVPAFTWHWHGHRQFQLPRFLPSNGHKKSPESSDCSSSCPHMDTDSYNCSSSCPHIDTDSLLTVPTVPVPAFFCPVPAGQISVRSPLLQAGVNILFSSSQNAGKKQTFFF